MALQDCSWRRRVGYRRRQRSNSAPPNFPDPITSCRWRRRPRCAKRTGWRTRRCGTGTRLPWGRTRREVTQTSARFFTWTGNTSKRRLLTARRWGCSRAMRRPSWTCTNWRPLSRDLVTRPRRTPNRETSVCTIRPQERSSTNSPYFLTPRHPDLPPDIRLYPSTGTPTSRGGSPRGPWRAIDSYRLLWYVKNKASFIFL